MEDVIRTVKVKLDVPDERCDDLHQTKDQFLHCANTTAAWAWRHPDEYCVTSKQQAENALYERLLQRNSTHCEPRSKGDSTRYRGYEKRCRPTQKGRDHQSTTLRRVERRLRQA